MKKFIFLLAFFAACSTQTDRYVLFTINTQEFVYLEKSIETLNRLIDIHEKHEVPVDIYLTEDILRDYEENAPELIERFKGSEQVAVSYHTRPPRPYHSAAYDFLGLSDLSEKDLYTTLLDYEEHATDRESGKTTDEPGGYEHIKDVIGYAPIVVGMPVELEEKEMADTLAQIYKEKGARFVVVHSDVDWGEERYGLLVRPEHLEVKLFEHVGEDTLSFLLDLWETSTHPSPTFMNIKVHDNDFIATESAWTTIYIRQKPPYHLKRGETDRELLSEEESEALWTTYETAVKYVSENPELYEAINALDLLEMLKE